MRVAAVIPSAFDSSLPAFDPSLDHFSRLGLEVVYDLGRGELESNYLKLSGKVHPDRFVTAESAQKRASMEHSAAINEAYKVLRNKISRAEYMVKLGGIDLNSSDPVCGAPVPEQVFLIEMLEVRDELEGKASQGADAIADMRDDIDGRAATLLKQAVDSIARQDIPLAAKFLVQHRYLARLLSELEEAETNL